MVAAILGLLTSLPKLLELGTNIWTWIQKVSGGDIAGFIEKANNAFITLHKAETDAEYAEAAKQIRDSIRGTRP